MLSPVLLAFFFIGPMNKGDTVASARENGRLHVFVLSFALLAATAAEGQQVNSGEKMIARTPWRTTEDVIDGWDWSLPPDVKPVPYSGVNYYSREGRTIPGNRICSVQTSWRELEPEEGRYDFDKLRKKLEDLPPDCAGAELHVYASVHETKYLNTGKVTPGTAPLWLIEKFKVPIVPEKPKTNIGTPFQVVNVDIWHPEYHSRYLRFVEAFGKTGIARMKPIMLSYVHGLSSSRGEEAGGRYEGRPEQCMRERLNAWADAFKGVEYKLAWVGAEGDILDYAYSLGMGQRNGFVEMYLLHCNNPQLGQTVDKDGYLVVDETCPPIAEGRAFGDENEEYSPKAHVARFGPMETWPHRYRESMLRALQMRRNFLWAGGNLDVDPQLLAYVSLELGRNVENAPDAWCYLRESVARHRGKPLVVKNFERWIYQRDRDGCRAAPTAKVDVPEQMWCHHPKHTYDYIARRTDAASKNTSIGFALDDLFLWDGPHKVAVKITYHDVGKGKWRLIVNGPNGRVGRDVQCEDTGKIKTATFFFDDACFPAKGLDFDFEIRALSGDAAISFVRVVKL